MSKTVGVIHEARTNYPSISPVGFLFGGVCVAHPVRSLCCAGSFYLSLFCVLCSALSVSLESLFCVLCSALLCSVSCVQLCPCLWSLCSVSCVQLCPCLWSRCSVSCVQLCPCLWIVHSRLLTINTQVKYWRMQEMFFKWNKGYWWLVFDTHKIAGFSSTRYPPQDLRFRNIFKWRGRRGVVNRLVLYNCHCIPPHLSLVIMV